MDDNQDLQRLECAARVLYLATDLMETDKKIARTLLHASIDLIDSCKCNLLKETEDQT